MMIFAAFFLLVVLLLYLYRHRIIAYVLLVMEDLGFYQEGPPDPVANPLPKEHVVMKLGKIYK